MIYLRVFFIFIFFSIISSILHAEDNINNNKLIDNYQGFIIHEDELNNTFFAANKGLESYLFIMAIISINLGLINLFPIPLLDGGHLLLYGVQSISKKVINEI